MKLEIEDKIKYLVYPEKQTGNVAVFYGHFNDFNKDKNQDKLWEVYESFRYFNKSIVPIVSPKDNNFFNHFFDMITIFDQNLFMEMELYLAYDFTENIKDTLLERYSSSIVIVENSIINSLPVEKRRKPFYDLVKSILGDNVKTIEVEKSN